ncbi:MAG TPA: ABC transporter permease [Candidatus Nanoarchaeia archaeon]|nr:ABC transporter permease [Candidatus Nanoarchaeia archaeon]
MLRLFMKLVKLVKKDLKLFKRDTRTLILTIVAPIIILFILGNVFGQSSTENSVSGISLGVCDLDNNSFEFNISLFNIIKLDGDCALPAKNLVSEGKLRASVIISEGFSSDIKEGKGAEIIFFVDNSKTQTAIVSSDAIKAFVQDLNEKIGTEFIDEAWIRLSNLNNNLKLVLPQLELARKSAVETQKDLADINKQLNKINESRLDRILNEINNTSPYLKQNLSSELDDIVLSLNNITSSSCLANSSFCPLLANITSSLASSAFRIKQKEESVNSLDIDILASQIAVIKYFKANITLQVKEINKTAFDFTNDIISVEKELRETSQALDVYTSRDPKTIIRAVSLNENPVFGDRTYFEFLSLGLILILLLFTVMLSVSSNIVSERNTGTLARTLLSPTSVPLFLVSKIIFFVIVSFIELFVMLIVSYFFGAPMYISLIVLLIMLFASVNFILIGMFVGSISRTENTALLTSLVIGLPMFFLSGLFFPFEIMPKFMRFVGANSPLTLAHDSLEKIVLYGTKFEYISFVKLVVFSLILFLVVYFIIKKKPTAG